ncbi:unnamed protein product [Calicophoron daubneyi]|uniref:Uncharacterized protein n=1 Tax=Calicophoron daubneyi TaxID=300641 RepID=A0AAV2U0X4_CALDB
MASGRGFVSGLRDFLAAPVRLWYMHQKLVLLNPIARSMENIHQHHLERTRRLQIRNKIMNPYSGGSTQSPPEQVTAFTSADSTGLFQPLVRMWFINVGLILLLAILSYLFSSLRTKVPVESWTLTSSALDVASKLISSFLHICLPLFMELVNMLYLKKICDRIALLKEKPSKEVHHPSSSSTEQSSSSLGATIMDRLYALIFFALFELQWDLISMLSSNYRISNLINIFAVAFMYSCYAIEYRWRQVSGRTFDGFLLHIVEHWTYFVGYGFLLGVGCFYLPHFIGWGGMLLAITYPILVIGALGSNPRTRSSFELPVWIEDRVSSLFRIPLALSLKPALFLTNLIVRSSVSVVYRLWF